MHPPAPPPPSRASDRAPRQYELDWLRLLAVVLVVLLHLAQTYARPNDPAAVGSFQSPTLAHLIALTSYWRMPVLFCVAGMVAVHTRGRRALGSYVRTRAERLLLPLFLGVGVLTPVQLALEGRLTGHVGLRFAWGYFWFLGALVAITVATIPVGSWLARPAVQARLAPAAERGGTLVLLAALPFVGALLPYSWVGDAPVLGHVGLKTLLGYAGDFVAGMVLASVPGFRATVMRRRAAALLVWAVAAAVQATGVRVGLEPHLPVLAEAVAGWAWVLACFGFATRYLSRPSRTIVRWAPRALAIYALHGVPLAAARTLVLPPALPLGVEVTLLVALTVFGALALVRGAEGFGGTARVFGLRYDSLPEPRVVAARLAATLRRATRMVAGTA